LGLPKHLFLVGAILVRGGAFWCHLFALWFVILIIISALLYPSLLGLVASFVFFSPFYYLLYLYVSPQGM